MTSSPAATPAQALPITRLFAKAGYVLFIAGCLVPPLLLVALVLNLARRGHARGTWLESHFRRQLHSFLIALLALGLVVLMLSFLSGTPYLLGVLVGAGSLSESTAMTLGLLLLAALAAPPIYLLIRMAGGLSALNRNEAA